MSERRVVDNGIRPRRPGSGSAPRSRRRAVDASEPAWSELRIDPAVEAAAALATYCDAVDAAIHVERRISRFLPFWADQSGSFDLAGVDHLATGLVEELEGMDDTPAWIVLRGLASVADAWLADPARAAADRIEPRLVPGWAGEIGKARAIGALELTGGEPGESGLLIESAYPSGDRHAIATYIDPRLGGIAKHIFLLQPIDAAPDGPLDAIDLDDARTRMRDALAITPPDGVPGGEGQFEVGALAWSRVR